MDIDKVLNSFKGETILVIGDTMVDQYFKGDVDRISPEAPVPILKLNRVESRLGGAANVALNLKCLGAKPVLVSICGDDENAILLDGLLRTEKIESAVLKSRTRKTTIKTRLIGNHQQLLRVDDEDITSISQSDEDKVKQLIIDKIEKEMPSAIILQDYNKGLLSSELIKITVSFARKKGCFIAVDPKRENIRDYIGVDLFKPNLKELADVYDVSAKEVFDNILKYSDKIRNELQVKFALITLSSGGLVISSDENTMHFGTQKRSVVDVCGAGDAVISIATLAFLKKLQPHYIAQLSNFAGGSVCNYEGVVPVKMDELRKYFLHKKDK